MICIPDWMYSKWYHAHGVRLQKRTKWHEWEMRARRLQGRNHSHISNPATYRPMGFVPVRAIGPAAPPERIEIVHAKVIALKPFNASDMLHTADFRYWCGTDPGGPDHYKTIAFCRGCETATKTKKERAKHVEECNRRLLERSLKNLRRSKNCVICGKENKAIAYRWGVPLCDDECRAIWKYERPIPKALEIELEREHAQMEEDNLKKAMQSGCGSEGCG